MEGEFLAQYEVFNLLQADSQNKNFYANQDLNYVTTVINLIAYLKTKIGGLVTTVCSMCLCKGKGTVSVCNTVASASEPWRSISSHVRALAITRSSLGDVLALAAMTIQPWRCRRSVGDVDGPALAITIPPWQCPGDRKSTTTQSISLHYQYKSILSLHP